MKARVSRGSLVDDLAHRSNELARLVWRDDVRQRLFDQFRRSESEEVEDGIVRLENLSVEIGDEHRIGRILDETFGVGSRLVELAHVAQHADDPNHLVVRIAQRRGVQAGRDRIA